MGIKKDLNFKGNDFSNIASAYAIAHLLMQGPNGRYSQDSGCLMLTVTQPISFNGFRHPNGYHFVYLDGV
jgi:hypothetical protein